MAASKNLNASLRDSNASYQIICRPCRTDQNESAVKYFCDKCQEYLCNACRQSHEQIKITKDHKISRAKVRKFSLCKRLQSGILPYQCACNWAQRVTLFCEDHNDAICVLCKHQKHRKCKSHFVTIEGKQTVENKRKNDTHGRMRHTSQQTKPVKKGLRASSEVSAAAKGKRGSHTIDSHTSIARSRVEKAASRDHTPRRDINMKELVPVFADQMEQSTSKNMRTETGSVFGKHVGFSGSVNIRVGPPGIGDYTGNWVTSMCLMPNGCPVLIEFSNNTVKVLDRDTFEIKGFTKLSGALADIAVVGEDTVIVTICFHKRLQYVQVFPEVIPGRTIQLENECYGVDVFGDEIFVSVTATWWTSGGEIKVLDFNGSIKRIIEISPDVHMLRWPRHLVISKSDGTIFLSDSYTSTLLCLTREGDVLFKYNNDELKGLHGLFLDKESNVYACGDDSRNVQLISKSGRKIAMLLDLTNIEGLREPRCVALREKDGTILIGGRHTDQLFIFKVTE